jgi:hypothetical protein
VTLSTEPHHAPGSKLPLWATIKLSYSTYFRNFADVLQVSWLWLIVAVVLSGVGGWMQGAWMTEALNSVRRGAPAQAVLASRPFALIVVLNLGNLFLLLGGVSIAVAWHRCIILNERPRPSGSNVFTRDVWRYCGWGSQSFCSSSSRSR